MDDLGFKSLRELAIRLTKDGPIKQEATKRRVRGLFAGHWIFDTTEAQHVWEHPFYPQLYIPVKELEKALSKRSDLQKEEKPIVVEGLPQVGFLFSFLAKNGRVTRGVRFETGALHGLAKFEFESIDQWFEENQPIYQHPKDPHKRIDVLPSSRKVSVSVDGVILAESTHPVILHETGLKTRFYLPKVDVNWEYLSESTTTSVCPYKGMANYYDVTINDKEHQDIVWWYRYPTGEAIAISGMVCFYNERVKIMIDDVQL